jgi:hypothetical protein
MLRPSNRGDAGENRHNSIIKDPPAFEDNQKLRGLLKLSIDASSKLQAGRQEHSSSPYSALGSDLQPLTPAQGTQAKTGPKLLKRSYPNPTQKKLPFLTSDSIHTQILHTITEKSKLTNQ